jgi:hypothetical protein
MFIRYRKDGFVIGSFDSLYVVTKEQGHWGDQIDFGHGPMKKESRRGFSGKR